MMLRLFLYSLVALSFAFVIASDLKSDLKAAGVTALFPGDPNYASSSTACKKTTLLQFFHWSSNILIYRQPTFYVQTCSDSISNNRQSGILSRQSWCYAEHASGSTQWRCRYSVLLHCIAFYSLGHSTVTLRTVLEVKTECS